MSLHYKSLIDAEGIQSEVEHCIERRIYQEPLEL